MNIFTIDGRNIIWERLRKMALDRGYKISNKDDPIFSEGISIPSTSSSPEDATTVSHEPWNVNAVYPIAVQTHPHICPVLVWMVDPNKNVLSKADVANMLENQFHISKTDDDISTNSAYKPWKGRLQLWIITHNTTYHKYLKELIRSVQKKNKIIIESFTYEEIICDRFELSIVPFQRPLNPEETECLRKQLGDIHSFDDIKRTDPIVRYYGMKPGEVLLITRPSTTNGFVNDYHVVEK